MRISIGDAIRSLKPDKMTDDENRVMKLVRQTPLSVSELIRGIENGAQDVRTPEKVISAIYTEDDNTQQRMTVKSRHSSCRTAVLQAVANLYLRRKVMLDLA
jgi:hypothetical protein